MNAIQTVRPHVIESHNRIVTTSLAVAEYFDKRHDHILRDIRTLLADLPEDFANPNFGECYKINKLANGKREPYYELTRDGFTLLAMGFTGKRALQFKIAYIDAFNKMEAALQERLLPPATITPAQQRAIQKLVADRVYASNLANTSMGFSAMYRALKDRFCIASYHQLPAVQFDEAVQFIADCPIETPKPTSEKLTPNDMTNIRRLLWAVSGQLNGGQSFVNMLWGCLREVTGRKSPSPFYVEDIPVIAKELKRIGEVLQPLSDAIYYAKKSAFRRLVKNREDVEKVMKEVKEQMNLDLLLKWKPSFMETEAFNCLLMRVKNPLPTSMEGYQEN